MPGEPPSRKVRIDVRLDEVVLRALERNPALRYARASAFKTEVETIAENRQPPIPAQYLGFEYKSKREWFGLPLLHIASGLDPCTMRRRQARGIVAAGDTAIGVVAMGGRAYGGIAFGGVACGGLAIGGLAVGAMAFGGLAIALFVALGGVAAGAVAMGGAALGYLAAGGEVVGVHLLGPGHSDPSLQWLLTGEKYLDEAMWTIWVVLFLGCYGLMWWARRKVFPCKPQEPKAP